jgi:ribosomal RNA assembly protein
LGKKGEKMQYVRIPKERVKILIGKGGETKRGIEERTRTKILIREETSVEIEGDEPINEWITKDIILAIGRGFTPENALSLLGEDKMLEIISLRDFCHGEKALKRKKARVIGERGKARRVIEELTNCYLSIYGKTIGIIGPCERVRVAKEAIFKLLDGSPHSTVYRFLEKNVHELKRNSRVM